LHDKIEKYVLSTDLFDELGENFHMKKKYNLNIEKNKEENGIIEEEGQNIGIRQNFNENTSKKRISRNQFRAVIPFQKDSNLLLAKIEEDKKSFIKNSLKNGLDVNQRDYEVEKILKESLNNKSSGKKRDTMLRELKSKLREKFPSNNGSLEPINLNMLSMNRGRLNTKETDLSKPTSPKLKVNLCDTKSAFSEVMLCLKEKNYGKSKNIYDDFTLIQDSDITKETLYGPGGVFGSHGPFSTPQISRYPRTTDQNKLKIVSNNEEDVSLKSGSSNTETSESAVFAEDRSDKSQYVANHVIKVPKKSTSRIENYSSKVSQELQRDKKQRTMTWITRSHNK